MHRVLVVLIVLLLVGMGVVNAQEPSESLCEESALNELADLLEGAATAIREGEQDIATILIPLRLIVSYSIADCTGLNFSSEVDGIQPTLGPFVLEAGTYLARATTDGYIIGEFTVLDGECGEGRSMSSYIFSLSDGQANDGAEVVVNSEGCEVLFSISNTREAWTIEFEKIR